MKILDVGQCGFDGPRIASLLRDQLHATVVNASTGHEAKKKLESDRFDVVLVNRLLASDGSSGIKLIEELKRSGSTVPIMLVSDRPDAQEKAVAAGALSGFGKSVMYEPETLEIIKSAAAGNSNA